VTAAPAAEGSETPPAEAAADEEAPATEAPAAEASSSTVVPAPETAAIVSPPAAAKTYAVQAGDTMYSIARKHGVSVDAILWANDLSDSNVLKQGQKLTIPPATGKLHTAKDGETLDSLATTYAVSKGGIAAVNGIAEDATLRAGQRLLIPSSTKPGTGDPAFTPTPLSAASSTEPVPIAPPADAGTGSPTPPSSSVLGSMALAPSIFTATGAPTVTVTNKKVPKLSWPVPVNPPKSGVSQAFRPGHTGIDIYAPQGTTIKAAAGGTIKMAEKNPDGFSGYGWIVIVDHGDGISTWYAHCGTFNVKTGDKVKSGDTLATVGMTGRTTGPHLHFELRIGATAVDPRLALS
jgi:murein DD-endopeptidase MepM/ murein hydrolase activator NlpD